MITDIFIYCTIYNQIKKNIATSKYMNTNLYPID